MLNDIYVVMIEERDRGRYIGHIFASEDLAKQYIEYTAIYHPLSKFTIQKHHLYCTINEELASMMSYPYLPMTQKEQEHMKMLRKINDG